MACPTRQTSTETWITIKCISKDVNRPVQRKHKSILNLLDIHRPHLLLQAVKVDDSSCKNTVKSK